ncbi:polysaccharide biosynthesis/export family protein [Rubellicoccus peritrichatus]|uniref:SLBB domain-containing protein n=1 Tax=Rubellicoccus peritrichatus TaxID=3080537 RepID=A0AAQ3QR50_9BACT|nr:polysaccharide biosynthesis/export family protein [Puniceicoccus sp. CR14]WOO40958.1 SLBB domain-containing protein [Puniceicoccus sp. CR14]
MKDLWKTIFLVSASSLFMLSLAAQSSVAIDTTSIDDLKEAERNEEISAISESFGLSSDGEPVFGAQLFQGDFKDLSFSGFNPEYQVGIGDKIQAMVWGALQLELDLTVDPQGNIFIPEVGPIKVLGVRNADLNEVISEKVKRVFSQNVEIYANLASAQDVKVFVSGYVTRPGLYQGFASDSVLYYLDRAGGIDLNRGSFIDITVKRGGKILQKLDLYEFLGSGTLPLTQFQDGDSIFVGSIRNTATVMGQVSNPARFEFIDDQVPLYQLLELATPEATATHVSIKRQLRGRQEAFFFPLDEAREIPIEAEDEVTVTSRHVPETILVTITGEHEGEGQQVLTYGAILADAIARIRPSSRSDINSAQLFRESVAERQKQLLNQMLDNLERTTLNARSHTLEEAQLRLQESEMIIRFIERGRQVQPKGQVLLDNPQAAKDIFLEDGDVIYIPQKTKLVTVYGEVKFPNTQIFNPEYYIKEYIEKAGGYTDNAETDEIILIRKNGLVENVGTGRWVEPLPGDEIFVLPKPDDKTLQFAKDISTILYQIALSARVVIGL